MYTCRGCYAQTIKFHCRKQYQRSLEKHFNVTIALRDALPYNFTFFTLHLCQIVHMVFLNKGAEDGWDIIKRQSFCITMRKLAGKKEKHAIMCSFKHPVETGCFCLIVTRGSDVSIWLSAMLWNISYGTVCLLILILPATFLFVCCNDNI